MYARNAWRLLRRAMAEYGKDGAPRLGAALAYYTTISLAPLLVIAVAVAGLVFGRAAAEGTIVSQAAPFVGPETARSLQSMIRSASQRGSGALATILGAGALLIGAGAVFAELQSAMNTVWDAMPSPREGIWKRARRRLTSFLMVLAMGLLLMLLLIINTVVSSFGEWAARVLPGLSSVVGVALTNAVSFAVLCILFAVIYALLPDVDIGWRDTAIGAIVTAALFIAGKYLIGIYLSRATVASAYGAAGSLVIILLWVYYSTQILFLGAELTKAYALMFGSRVVGAAVELPRGSLDPERQALEHTVSARRPVRARGAGAVVPMAVSLGALIVAAVRSRRPGSPSRT